MEFSSGEAGGEPLRPRLSWHTRAQGVPAAPAATPRLTTIRQPRDRISNEMVRVLLAQTGGEDAAAAILPTESVRRESA